MTRVLILEDEDYEQIIVKLPFQRITLSTFLSALLQLITF